ncbi:MAG TPA: hypothetical protein VFZ25_21625, partial [Chloroflexota bacterium]|nr:hypothetical protein [Chloroflexota bacterium]
MQGSFRTNRRFIVVVVCTIVVLAASLWRNTPGISPTVARANSAPTNPAQAYYVDETWTDPINYNGIDTTYAYQIGYAASVGQPSANSIIIIDFGRQYDDSSEGWGICLTQYNSPCGKHYHNDDWVASVAEKFMMGYSAG